jgi:hypothetical protein
MKKTYYLANTILNGLDEVQPKEHWVVLTRFARILEQCLDKADFELVHLMMQEELKALKADGPVQTCRGCGCTFEDACDGGCSWVEANLCSECVPENVASGKLRAKPNAKKARAREGKKRAGVAVKPAAKGHR